MKKKKNFAEVVDLVLAEGECRTYPSQEHPRRENIIYPLIQLIIISDRIGSDHDVYIVSGTPRDIDNGCGIGKHCGQWITNIPVRYRTCPQTR